MNRLGGGIPSKEVGEEEKKGEEEVEDVEKKKTDRMVNRMGQICCCC
jgi:hypothetical protein